MTSATHHTLQVPRTAHLHQLGSLSAETKHLWVVCHGYGQLARYFIRHFEGVADAQTVVIAPEALSRFYLNGFSGRVGATWMTKEERLSEIEDYIAYLNMVRQTAMAKAPEATLHVLGFSQGAATVCRWLAQANWPVAELILWAGVFPEDMELATVEHTLAHTKLTYVYGLQDKMVTPERLQEQLAKIAKAGLQPNLITFQGIHELNAQVLRQLKDG
ncbi:alpha/beta hydrolase [Rufibacter radiotolerans]|uniref:alpha/beta hydrolase n=1 Tax=Rufibacter radiotolerans TaxID=1379910 RepID=UPI0006645007|nr:alpha/beta hydrolase [Rufibacter radiotolerans]